PTRLRMPCASPPNSPNAASTTLSRRSLPDFAAFLSANMQQPRATDFKYKLNDMTTNGLIAFLFPGQGSQSLGMGKDLADQHPIARQTFEEADEALGCKLSQVCCEGPEDQLRLTEITQPAILTVSIAAWRVVSERGLKPDFVAGHSLGEYSAHVAAG